MPASRIQPTHGAGAAPAPQLRARWFRARPCSPDTLRGTCAGGAASTPRAGRSCQRAARGVQAQPWFCGLRAPTIVSEAAGGGGCAGPDVLSFSLSAMMIGVYSACRRHRVPRELGAAAAQRGSYPATLSLFCTPWHVETRSEQGRRTTSVGSLRVPGRGGATLASTIMRTRSERYWSRIRCGGGRDMTTSWTWLRRSSL